MLSPKIFHLSQDKLGLNESYQEFHKDPLFCVLCDALYLPKPEEGPKIAKDFERIIKKYLSIHRHNLNERTLKKALSHAQKHFFNKYSEDQDLLKLAALILVEPSSHLPDQHKYFYIAGVGDFKVFEIQKSPTLLFYDSETPKLPIDLSLKKRFQYVTNALGQPSIKSSVVRIKADERGPLLLMSYGTYSSLSEEKWIQLASDFLNKKNHIVRTISKLKEKDHRRHFLYISFERDLAHKTQISPPKPPLEDKVFSKDTPTRGSHFFKWIFKVSIVCVLGLCILELTHNYPLISLFSSSDTLKSPIKEPDMQLNLRSLKGPFRFPFIKERAYFVDMKKTNERQARIIDKLTSKIAEQDRALRDLQIKTYYPTAKLKLPHNDALFVEESHDPFLR